MNVGQYSTVIKLQNITTKKLNFRVISNNPANYRMIPDSGIIERKESYKIQVLMKELLLDFEKDEFQIEARVEESDSIWRPVDNRLTKKLGVQTASKREEKTLTKQQGLNRPIVDLEIRRAIANEEFFLETEHDLFFKSDTVPKAIKQFFIKQYNECLTEALKFYLKRILAMMIERGTFQKFDLRPGKFFL